MKASGRLGRSAASRVWILMALLALSACGGGAPATDNVLNGTAVGPVTGFGSVKIGGAVFSGDNATIVDDRGRKIDNVVEGMLLTVRGTIDQGFHTGSAGTITIERVVRGPVDDNAVDLANNAILVLGQEVLVNPATVMVRSGGGEFGLGDLKTDQDNNSLRPELEVHGARDLQGFLHATFVGRGQDNVVANDNVGLQGEIQGLIGNTFRIEGQKVDYTGIKTDGKVNWPILTGLSNGLVVDVRGRLDAVGGSGTVWTDRAGDRIEVKKSSLGNPLERVLIEGYVLSGTVSSSEMSAPGGIVKVNGGGPLTGGTFGVGQRVQVKGTVVGTAGTTVQASAIHVMRPNEVLMEGAPDKGSIDPSAETMKLLGQKVAVDDLTLFRDGTGTVRKDFGLASLSDNNTVRVAGWFDGSVSTGKVVATRVDRLSLTAPDNVTAQGVVVENPIAGSFRILGYPGIVVNTGLKLNTEYFLEGHVPTDVVAFFGNLSVGTTVVKVRRGVYQGGPPRISEPDPGGALGTMEVEIVRVNN